MSIIKEIKKSPFKNPTKRYYLGKIKFGTPYFTPRGFSPTIIKLRKLKRRNRLEYDKARPRLIHDRDSAKYENIPEIRRCKDWIFKFLDFWFWLELGSPIKISKSDLNWKEKFGTPRFQSAPSYMIFFFWWQFCIYYESPNKTNHHYWEMFLWWKHWSDKDLDKAKSTWPWVHKGKSTWDDNLVSKAYHRNNQLKKLGI